jgi:shikimate kinase
MASDAAGRLPVLLQRDGDEFKAGTVIQDLPDPPAPPVPDLGLAGRSVVLVGLMGAGKSSIGRRLAQRLGLEFLDADTEIERAAGCTIEEIFARFGEPAFRDGERRVILRLLEERAPIVLATGGGAFMDAETRAAIRNHAIAVWLRAELDVLLRRVARRSNRPLLKQGDPREVLERLMALRHPVYAEADLVVESDESPAETTVDRVIAALRAHLAAQETSP